jgi:hypothetical protein
MKEQTAVEWLVEELKGVYESDYLNKLIDKAKAMEKEQIETAFFKGDLFAEDYFDADNPTKDVSENYYNKTFKSE